MEDFFAYFHVEETNSVYRTLGHIHDTFVREIDPKAKVYVGWDTEKHQQIVYRVKIDSPFLDDDRISSAFHNITTSFDGNIKLGILLSKPYRGKFVLLDLVEA